MKKFAAMALGALLLASCAGNKEKTQEETLFSPIDYTLAVTDIEGNDSAYIYLYDYDALKSFRNPNADALIDSVMVTNGQANFTVAGSSAPVAILMVNGQRAIVFPEAGENTYNFKDKIGSGAIANKYKAYNDSVAAINEWIGANLPERGTPAYDQFTDSVSNVLDIYQQETLTANMDNALGYFMAVSEASSDPEKADSILSRMPVLEKSQRMKNALEDVAKLKATSPGQPYKDFTIESEGKSVKLSDYVKPGQYTLVDFWASWCGPCKRAIAGLKKDYKALHDKGLNIVGVTVWEPKNETEAWLKENPLPWDIILDAQSLPTDLYVVKGIPTLVLIGPDGTIIARSHSDEEILEAFNAAIAPAQ